MEERVVDAYVVDGSEDDKSDPFDEFKFNEEVWGTAESC